MNIKWLAKDEVVSRYKEVFNNNALILNTPVALFCGIQRGTFILCSAMYHEKDSHCSHDTHNADGIGHLYFMLIEWLRAICKRYYSTEVEDCNCILKEHIYVYLDERIKDQFLTHKDYNDFIKTWESITVEPLSEERKIQLKKCYRSEARLSKAAEIIKKASMYYGSFLEAYCSKHYQRMNLGLDDDEINNIIEDPPNQKKLIAAIRSIKNRSEQADKYYMPVNRSTLRPEYDWENWLNPFNDYDVIAFAKDEAEAKRLLHYKGAQNNAEEEPDVYGEKEDDDYQEDEEDDIEEADENRDGKEEKERGNKKGKEGSLQQNKPSSGHDLKQESLF